MSDELVTELEGKLREAQTAVANARSRARLRGEHLELVIATDRLTEATELLAVAR